MNKALTTFLFLVLLTSCVNQKVINDIQIITEVGYDIKNQNINISAIYPEFKEKGAAQLQLISTESSSFYDLLPRLNTISNQPIELGQMRTVLLGKDFAQNKTLLTTLVDTLYRNPDIGTRMHLGVTENTAEKLFNLSKQKQDPFLFNKLINHNIEYGNLPDMNLHLFAASFYGRGRDPYLPYIVEDRGSLKIDGLALFQGKKYVHHINMSDAFIFKFLNKPIKNGRTQVNMNSKANNHFILFLNIDSKTNFTLTKINPVPEIRIDVKMNVLIQDVPPFLDISESNNIINLQEKIENQFEKSIQNLLSVFQKYKVDPLGFEKYIKGHSRKWNEKDFVRLYPDLKFNVKVQTKILQTGSGE